VKQTHRPVLERGHLFWHRKASQRLSRLPAIDGTVEITVFSALTR
jgi:hypothetical protein